MQGRQAVVGYVAKDGTATTRTLHPLGLAVKASTWYLVADTEMGQRTFRVDRVRSLEITDDLVVRPEGFDLTQAWKLISDNLEELRAPVRARALVKAEYVSLLRWLFNNRLRIGPAARDGRVEVELRSSSARALQVRSRVSGPRSRS